MQPIGSPPVLMGVHRAVILTAGAPHDQDRNIATRHDRGCGVIATTFSKLET